MRVGDLCAVISAGCEWAALDELAQTTLLKPGHDGVLSRVGQLLIEVHMTPAYGFNHHSQLSHSLALLQGQGLALYRAHVNVGSPRDRNLTHPDLVRSGWTVRQDHTGPQTPLGTVPCCAELQFVRPW